MLFATNHTIKANRLALLAVHRGMYFDSATDISDAHLSEDNYVSKVKGVRAWGNSQAGTENAVTLCPMSGAKNKYYYPARSASLVRNVAAGGGYGNYTTGQTSKQMMMRYFCIQEVSGVSLWADGAPVFTGQNGPSIDTSTNYYWPTPCMLSIPANIRTTNVVETYSSKVGAQYDRYVDPFWKNYSGYDGGYNNAALTLGDKSETAAVGYSYISTNTTTPIQTAALPSAGFSVDHIIMLRPVGNTYTYSGVNQYSTTYAPITPTSGVNGYVRDANAFNMRVATSVADTADVTLTSFMMAINVNGFGYLIRSPVGLTGDIVQDAPTATGVVASLPLASTQLFPAKTKIDL